MNREKLLEKASEFYARLIGVLKEKSEGYTGDDGPFATYTYGAQLADIDTEQSIVARIGEKFKRFEHGWKDTQILQECADDIPNLLFTLIAYRREMEDKFQPPEDFQPPAETVEPVKTFTPKIDSLLQKLGLKQ